MCATYKKKELRVLCINPWIYDFTAFDLWSKPLGLLYIAGLLKKTGVRVDFIDCLDKWHPELLRRQGRVHPKLQKYGTGHFHREVIQKPACFDFVPRYYARYGLPEDIFIKDLQRLNKPDAILVTSIMTYWYSGPQRVVEICRSLFPGVPVVLGGIYATLMPDHARKNIQPDYLIEGPGEYKITALLASLFNRADLLDGSPNDIDAFPPPAFELLHHNDYYVTMTSRGCPFRCTFCATYKVDSQFTQRKPEQVCHEILTQTARFNVQDVVFYDDALLMQSSRHIKPLLKMLASSESNLRFHAPNGLHGRYIDEELADLMFRCHFKTIRISLESVAKERRRDIHNKITPGEMTMAVQNLVRAGYKAEELETYIIMGLPGQNLEEVIETILYAHNLGVNVRLASFSPIPGTEEYDRAVACGYFPQHADPLLTNKTIIPLYRTPNAYRRFQAVRNFTNLLNDKVKQGKRIRQVRKFRTDFISQLYFEKP